MAVPQEIELGDGTIIPLLYEDRSLLAIDKPPGWILAPDAWDRTGRNLQLALESALSRGAYWVRSRNLKFLRFVHRLDAGTSGVLLLAKSRGALQVYSKLFERRQVEKVYLVVVQGVPEPTRWSCNLEIVPAPGAKGRMRVLTEADAEGKGQGQSAIHNDNAPSPRKQAETWFRVIKAGHATALVEARPATGRTHQIRVHLAAGGHPVCGDTLYGSSNRGGTSDALALRAILLAFRDPFTRRAVRIEAPFVDFARSFGFNVNRNELFPDAKRQMI